MPFRKKSLSFPAQTPLLICALVLLLEGLFPALAIAQDAFFTVPPCRIYDSRLPTGSPPMVAGETRSLQISGLCGIPDGATAVSLNLTSVNPQSGGYFRIYPWGTTPPFTSTLNNVPGRNVANQGIYMLSASGAINLHLAFTTSAHPVVDVNGYFAAATNQSSVAEGPFYYQSLTDCRALDTRTGPPVPNMTPYPISMKGICGVASTASAAVMSFKLWQPTAVGWASFYPSDLPLNPAYSLINITPPETHSNGAVVGLANSPGDMTFYYRGFADGPTVHTIIDTTGYFGSAGKQFFPLAGCRAVDTRQSGGPLTSNQPRAFDVRGACGIPEDATAVAASITVITPSAAGDLVVYPSGTSPGTASHMSFEGNRNLANGGIVDLGADASGENELIVIPRLAVGTAQVHVVIDVQGYFAGAGGGQSPWGGTPPSLPAQRVQAENYDLGGQGLAYNDTTPTNLFGQYRTDGMDVGAIPTGGFHVGALEPGEWARYTVNITQTQSYQLRIQRSSAFPTNRLRVRLDGNDISGPVTIDATGSWDTYAPLTIPVGQLTAGNNRVLQFDFEAGHWNFDWFELVTCTAPTVSIQGNATRNLGKHDDLTLTANVTGTPQPTLEWLKNGVSIGTSGTTTSFQVIDDALIDDEADYQVRASNGCGSPVTSAPVHVNVNCEGPGDLIESIVEVMANPPRLAVCNWRKDYRATFPNSMGDGSFNLPVLAAAVALKADPNMPGPDAGTNVIDWWKKYLRGELGERGSTWYYGAKELFSAEYQYANTLSVMTVHLQAHLTGQNDLRVLARRWLRATFALQAAASARFQARTFHDRGLECPKPLPNYDGPYLPLAGMRSAWVHWQLTNQTILLHTALGIPNNGAGEEDDQEDLRLFLNARWNATGGPEGSVYGLTAGEAGQLAAIKDTGQLPQVFGSMYAGIRTIVPYHIVAWPGVRVTLMEQNRNYNTAPTFGAVFFEDVHSAQGREAHFLFPWNRGASATDPCRTDPDADLRPWRHDLTAGLGVLNLSGRYVYADNRPGNSLHPYTEVTIDNLQPGSPPQYHIVLTP